MAIAGLLFSEPLLVLMSTPPASLALAVAYMRVIFLALPFIYMYAFVGSVLRGAGDSKTPFYFMLLSVAIDIGLNPLFIFGWGPVPALGIAGSALATFMAQLIALIALLMHLYRQRHLLVLHKEEMRHLSIDWAIVGTLVKKGIPMCAQMLVVSLSAVLMIALVNNFGVDTGAAYGAAMQLWNYIMMPTFAVGMAVSAMAAQNVGAQKWDRVNAIARVGVAFSVMITGSIVLLIELLDTHAFQIFLPTGSVALQIATHLNHVVTWSYIFFGVSMVLFGVVRATGAVMAPLAVLAVSMLGVRFPLAELLIGRYQIDAIWWSFPISSALAAVLAVLYYKYGNWRSARMVGGPRQGMVAPSPEG
jgi:putative MATE family efflux protein